MKRFIKKTLFLLAMAVAVAGCNSSMMNDEEDDSVPQDYTDNGGDEGFLCAIVENASKYGNVVEVKLMVHDRSINKYVELTRFDWKDDGFMIVLPKTLGSNNIYALIRDGMYPTNIDFVQSTMTISNENVRVGNVYFVGVDKNGNAIATFFSVKIDENGNTKAIFTYTDSNVNISGYTYGDGHAHPACLDCPSWFEKTTSYFVDWEKGWNVWYLSISHTRTDYVAITTEQWSTAPVSGLKWHGSEENLQMFQD